MVAAALSAGVSLGTAAFQTWPAAFGYYCDTLILPSAAIHNAQAHN
jgi:hypothetical protein